MANVQKVQGPDGRTRTASAEAKLDKMVAAALGGAAGRELMDYLRSITTNVAAGPEISDRALMHLEGQRFLVALLNTRIQNGHRENRNVTRQEGSTG